MYQQSRVWESWTPYCGRTINEWLTIATGEEYRGPSRELSAVTARREANMCIHRYHWRVSDIVCFCLLVFLTPQQSPFWCQIKAAGVLLICASHEKGSARCDRRFRTAFDNALRHCVCSLELNRIVVSANHSMKSIHGATAYVVNKSVKQIPVTVENANNFSFNNCWLRFVCSLFKCALVCMTFHLYNTSQNTRCAVYFNEFQ